MQVRRTFSASRAWRPTVGAGLTRTLGVVIHMPSRPSLQRLIAKTKFFGDMNPRLAALERLHVIVEQQLDQARITEIARVRDEHSSADASLHPDDREFDLMVLEQQVTHLLPKLMRGGLLLTTWSTFERSVKDIAHRTAKHVGRPLSDNYFRKKSFVAATDATLSSCAGIVAFPDAGAKARLELLASVRNTLVHHDGRLDEAPENIPSHDPYALAGLGLQVERDYSFEYLVPTEVFLKDSIDLVYQQTHDLASRVFDALFPPDANDA